MAIAPETDNETATLAAPEYMGGGVLAGRGDGECPRRMPEVCGWVDGSHQTLPSVMVNDVISTGWPDTIDVVVTFKSEPLTATSPSQTNAPVESVR